MHLNYHFLKFLCPVLDEKFKGQKIISCFSQSKDELIFETEGEEGALWIRAHLKPPQIYLSFPDNFRRAKRNSINLFPELLEETINSCEVLSFERSFIFRLNSGKILLFKLHANRSNVLLFETDQKSPFRIFRNEISEDKNLDWKSLLVSLELTRERFDQLGGNASQFLPTLGKIPRSWLKEKGYPNLELDKKWELMEEIRDLLEAPLFALIETQEGIQLSLLPEDQAIKTFSNPIEATNELFYLALVKGNFEKEKNELLKKFQDQLKKTESYLTKATSKLEELKLSPPPSQLADIVMANLHEFRDTKQEVELFDFYSGKTVKVKLKPQQKPQDFAAQLYRKSKNRKLEWEQIEKTIQNKNQLKNELVSQIQNLNKVEEFRGLKTFKKEEVKEKSILKSPSSLPFKSFEIYGFQVWVGKSAKANDEMLRGFVHKDDLWLHARLVPGSHVVIKMKGFNNIPPMVLERAAELAAFYSKHKNESLAPVIYTEAKFVRKVKGSPDGSVKVDRENVIMVKPKGPDDSISNQK
ncbi:NFACT RNA binding domain-containing protein [Algoriphagus sp.]|uniref:NFACT RNA binding domain-containing protein n=1 Tax=Algoriphagus sp. TaxID=1872435 RepID=UPI0025D842E2|nr:NFACT RNA binding domain-containing protein [Algoriphagus sp.]